MPQGAKSSYSDQQRRPAEYIETACEKNGFSTQTVSGRPWAAADKLTGGGKKNGAASNKKEWLFVRFSQKPESFTLVLGHAR
jgi:hypothetical protein